MKFRMKKILSVALACTLAFSIQVPAKQAKVEAAEEVTAITINGSDVDEAAENINGLTYKGFGMLNGNSTSNLLLEYKDKAPEKYNEMMTFLFGGDKPLFTHIKMEMGNDGNNSTGAEACTMRYEDEEADASRSPGFVMVADAKAINPNVKVSILRWCMPNWVRDKWNANKTGQGYEAVYTWYRETIFDAYEKYGYVVDFVNPDVNETGNPDSSFIKWYKNRVENETDFPAYMDKEAREAYNNIRIIASDENKGLKIVPAMRDDADLYEAVDIIGFHYRTDATEDYIKMADVDDKEVWYSEGCATFGYTELQENKTIEYGANSIGGYQSPLALVDSFITAFDSSRRTHYMFQPAIGSFYEGIQYGHKELLSARDPWSGYIHYDPALYMLQHFSKFAKTGWEDSNPDENDIWRVIRNSTDGSFAGDYNEHATAGIDGNAGYMTLAAPDKSNYSVVFVNNTKNEKKFTIETADMGDANDKQLYFWLTETDKYMQNKGKLEKEDGKWVVTLPAYCVATATTLDIVPERTPDEGIHNEDRAVLDTDDTGAVNGVLTDDVLYADDFEYREEADDFLQKRGNEPRYMLDTHSAWVVEDGRLKQELAKSVDQWNGGDPSTIVGDFRWMDTITSIDMELANENAGTWGALTVRAQTGMNWNNSGYSVRVYGDGKWELYRINNVVESGNIDTTIDNEYTVAVSAIGDVISVTINNKKVVEYKDDKPMLSGRVKISSGWTQCYFDNLLVEKAENGIPYASVMVDGQDDCVEYDGTWNISNPGSGSADNWYRTLSTTSSKGASFSFPLNGTGFAITGGNDGTAVLDVYVDGKLADSDVKTLASPTRGETYILTELEQGAHKIDIEVKSGKLNIDAIHMIHVHEEECRDNGDGTHTIGCKYCSDGIKEVHKYVNGTCTICKAMAPTEPTTKPTTPTPTTPTPTTPAPTTPTVQTTQLAAPAVKTVKSMLTNNGSVVKVVVNKVANADAYEVYRKVGSKVKKIGTTTTGTINDKAPVSNKKATYYAIATSKKATFKASAAGAGKAVTLAKDTAKVKVKKSGKNIVVSFKKVAKAKGYIVYRATKKNGTYTKLTKKPIKAVKYTDKKAKAKKTYYYKVVVYGNNKTYSAGKISAKIKK